MKKICLALLMGLCVLLSSCNKVDRYYLKGVDKEMIPYQLGDTVCFFDDNGSPITLAVTNIEDVWDVEDDAKSEIWRQIRYVQLQQKRGDLGLTFQIWGLSYNGVNNRPLTIRATPALISTTMLYDLSRNFKRIKVYDTLLIGNQEYYDVAEQRELYKNDTQQLLYNKAYGVLQMKSNDKIVLRRIP